MDVQEKFLQAMNLLAKDAVERAGYDKTIQAQIVSCEDATIGKYRCRYQDSMFFAYSNNSDVTYNNNAYVYILVPGNDFKKEKTILGTTEKLGINYISQAEGDEAYDIVGTNCFESSGIYYLNSDNENYSYAIYDRGSNVSDNLVLNMTSLEQYIRESSSLIAGATFKTNLAAAKQSRGHYGIVYNLRFWENTSDCVEENLTAHTGWTQAQANKYLEQNTTVKSYIVNEDNMIDNPYRLAYPTRQYEIFDVDGTNFIRVESIVIFNSGFPGASGGATTGRLSSGDIEITNLELNGAIRMSDTEINGVAIQFETLRGTYFAADALSNDYKTITAKVKVKGKMVSSYQDIPFYWGRENVGITPSHPSYNKYLGRGWTCLNDSNVIEGTDLQPDVVTWVPGSNTIIVNLSDATARDNKYKVAIIYDNTVITKEINIKNLAASTPELSITSSTGTTQFYYDIGHPTLTCLAKVNGIVQNGLTYSWAYQSDTGVLMELPETTQLNSNYASAVAALTNLETAISNGTKFANAEKDNLTTLRSAVAAYDFIQRVDGNKIYDVQIKDITNRGIFKCSVYNNTTYLGTAAITLTNSLDGEGVYSLVINNGAETFQYNENGVAPTSKSLDMPQQLKALSFTVYDNLGQPIDSDIILRARDCSITWYFPIEDTLLSNKKINEDGKIATDETTGDEIDLNDNLERVDLVNGYAEYTNNLYLIYDIYKRYDVNKKRNQIKLNVKFKGMDLTAETAFTFVKQGEPGTNGTEFIVKLIPNTKMSNSPLYPMVTKRGSQYYLNYGINNTNTETNIGIGNANSTSYQFFKAQLWCNGELIWEGNKSADYAKDGITQPTLVHWEILQNKYTSSVSDESAFGIYDAGIGQIYYKGDQLQNHYSTPFANIIKCSINWNGKLYYGTIPITTAWTSDEKYRVSLKDDSGFRYVMYTSDGVFPQYDSAHPFEFICEEKINNVWEDISLIESKNISYTPSSSGNIVIKITSGTAEYSNQNLLTLLDQEWYRINPTLNANQWRYEPAARYDGQCVNATVLCEYKQGNTTIGKISIPIHFLLNKYGLDNINDWDGNSIQIKDNGQNGYILAPQMGAGTKDNNNNFTGVLMGKIKVAGKRDPDTGVLGYSSGDRTFFLNSDNGSALFGKAGNGQIIIDPNGNKALLYSSNFWKNYNSETGLPQNYANGNVNTPTGVIVDINPTVDQNQSRGMLIDLTTPQIAFGSGNFSVDWRGYLVAKGGGSIAGWRIADYQLYSNINGANSGNKALTLETSHLTDPTAQYNATTNPYIQARIYSNNHSTLSDYQHDGFYISQDGLSIGSRFKVLSNGVMMIGYGAVRDDGPGGNSNQSPRHWRIADTTYTEDGSSVTGTYIAYNTDSFANVVSAETQNLNATRSVYLGTDGFSLGNRFSVDYQGNVEIRRGTINMGTTTGQLKIKLDNSHNLVIGSNGRVELETDSQTHHSFYVSTSPSQLEINIRQGSINFGNSFIVDNYGHMYANSGQIGHFVITNDYLANGTNVFAPSYSGGVDNSPIRGIYFGKDGLSLGRGFSVDTTGKVNIRKGELDINQKFHVYEDGSFFAIEGSIGGIQIFSNQILGGIRDENNYTLQSGFSFHSSGQILTGPPGNRFYLVPTSASQSIQGGDLQGLDNGVYKCGIQPGIGMAKFQDIDIQNNISIGGTIQGFTAVAVAPNTSSTGTLTYLLQGEDGMILTKGGLKGYAANTNMVSSPNTTTFWISAASGQSRFAEVNTDSLILNTSTITVGSIGTSSALCINGTPTAAYAIFG